MASDCTAPNVAKSVDVGALGWLIVAPILLGALLGRWLDDLLGQGVFWTGSFIFVGAAIGFYLAWRRMESER